MDQVPTSGNRRHLRQHGDCRWSSWIAVLDRLRQSGCVIALFLIAGAAQSMAQGEHTARAVESRWQTPIETQEMVLEELTPPPADGSLAGWWDSAVRQPLWSGTAGYDTLLDDLVARTLWYSLQVKAASQQVLIRQAMVGEACSVFDWATFLESKWQDLDEPVGNTLTTGGPPRLRENQTLTEGGVRKRTQLGGEFELSQQLGVEHSNSLFFVPINQGQTRLALSYRQPLLRVPAGNTTEP